MSPGASSPSKELIGMVMALAQVRARMPTELRDIIKKEYGLNVGGSEFLGVRQYTAGVGKLTPDLRFVVKQGRVFVRAYKRGDWESAVKRAYDDSMSQTGVFGGLSIELPEPTAFTDKAAPPARSVQPKRKGVLDRFLGMFVESDD